MEFIKGITFSPFSPKGSLSSKEAKNSLKNLIEGTGANYIVLVPNALQETPQSEEIDFTSDATVSDKELISMINHIHKEGLHVFLKPTVNCKNGTWRAHINFFDEDVPCEPKWSNWFDRYTWSKLISNPTHICRIDTEDFVQEMSMILSERDNVVSLTLHTFGIIFYQQNATWRIIT